MPKENKDLKSSPDTLREVLPGDRLATIEEFDPGAGSAVSGELVVATTIGRVQPDMSNRIMQVVPPRNDRARLPEVGDYVIGNVQSAASSIAQVRIDAINDVPSNKDLTGMLSLRDDRHRRSAPPVKMGDTIRARVLSTTNSIFHLNLEGKDAGVLYTVCSNCGGSVVAIGRDRVKCRECGYVDERQLSEDFVIYSRSER